MNQHTNIIGVGAKLFKRCRLIFFGLLSYHHLPLAKYACSFKFCTSLMVLYNIFFLNCGILFVILVNIYLVLIAYLLRFCLLNFLDSSADFLLIPILNCMCMPSEDTLNKFHIICKYNDVFTSVNCKWPTMSFLI